MPDLKIDTRGGYGRCPVCGIGAITLETHPRSQRYELHDLDSECPVSDPDCLSDADECHDACEPGPGYEWVRVDVDDEPTERIYCDECGDLAHDDEFAGRLLDVLPAPAWENPR